mmetsp:Transcript_11415/g.24409  ORF Transcript_11415/g.24409 Transcript_11415/m.24409 type:complete len:154 (-) Transcript_11415:183-644(-)
MASQTTESAPIRQEARVVSDTVRMIAGMKPQLTTGTFHFCHLALDDPRAATLLPKSLCMFREAEGLSLILSQPDASEVGLGIEQPMRHITLMVYSALDGVGLTAAVSTALAVKGIPCNVVAAFHHDHVFVPAASAGDAMECLLAVTKEATPLQ